jgi:hypothetical protein
MWKERLVCTGQAQAEEDESDAADSPLKRLAPKRLPEAAQRSAIRTLRRSHSWEDRGLRCHCTSLTGLQKSA